MLFEIQTTDSVSKCFVRVEVAVRDEDGLLNDVCVGQKFVLIKSNFAIPNVSILMFVLTVVLTFVTQKPYFPPHCL